MGPPSPTATATQEQLPWGGTSRSQEYCQETVATAEWLVTTKKCHGAGVMVRRPLYFVCAQNMWAHILESQYMISFRLDKIRYIFSF